MVCRFDPVQNGGHGIDKHSHEQPRSGIDAVRDRVAAGDSTRGGIAPVDRAAVPGRIRAVRSVLVCRSRLNVGRDGRTERSTSSIDLPIAAGGGGLSPIADGHRHRIFR